MGGMGRKLWSTEDSISLYHNQTCTSGSTMSQFDDPRQFPKEDQERIHIPLCYKCSNVIVQQDFLDPRREALKGCKVMSSKQWNKGWHADAVNGLLFQHNCPLMKSQKPKTTTKSA